MQADYIIKNGYIADPSQDLEGIGDIAVRGSYIIDNSGAWTESEHIIDASGCIVAPGLIDFHTHVFAQGSGFGLHPDLMAAQGTTAAVDAGTAGCANFEAFYSTSVIPSVVRMKSFLNLYSGGQFDSKFTEDFNPALYNADRIERIIDKYRENILGLKVRISRGIVPDDQGADYLKKAVELAETLGRRSKTELKVCVHATNSPVSAGELADCLRPGDIFCHCYHGGQNNIILPDGSVDPGVMEARKRGVIFDAANGRGNFSLAVAKQALAEGFLPDIISSDLTADKFNMPPYAKNLPVVLSKYLTLGMKKIDVFRAATSTPAKHMGMEGQIGTLSPGAYADITIIKEKTMPVRHRDSNGVEMTGNTLLVPVMTFCSGQIQYCSTDFWV